MKKDYLLPVGFKKIGWILLLPSVLLGCYMLFLQDKLNWLDSLNEHLLNNTALIGTAIGLIFIGFARERNEDEMITSLRLNSLFISVYANYILLILLALRLRVPDLHVRTAVHHPGHLLPAFPHGHVPA